MDTETMEASDTAPRSHHLFSTERLDMTRSRPPKLLFLLFIYFCLLKSSVATAQSPSVMSRMGFSGFRAVSKAKAEAVRGKGFFLGGGLQGQSIIAAGLLEYEQFSLGVTDRLNLTKELEFEVNLSEYRHQLGSRFDTVDLSEASLRVKQVVDLSKEFNLGVSQTRLIGKDVVFGSSIRVIGGIFP